MSINAVPDLSVPYSVNLAESGKFVKLDMSSDTVYPLSGDGKYAILTYDIGSSSSSGNVSSIATSIGSTSAAPAPSPTADASLIAIQKAIFDVVLRSFQFASGQNGSQILSDADSVSGTFTGFTVITDTELTSITSTSITDASKLVGVTLPGGVTIYGEFSAIEVTTGTIQIHNI